MRVGRRRIDPDVEIAGRARAAVVRERVGADDQESDLSSANARNRSTKSGFIGPSSEQLPLLNRQTPHEQHPLIGRQLRPELGVVPVRVGIRREAPAGDDGVSVASGICHQVIISAEPPRAAGGLGPLPVPLLGGRRIWRLYATHPFPELEDCGVAGQRLRRISSLHPQGGLELHARAVRAVLAPVSSFGEWLTPPTRETTIMLSAGDRHGANHMFGASQVVGLETPGPQDDLLVGGARGFLEPCAGAALHAPLAFTPGRMANRLAVDHAQIRVGSATRSART